jgi:hypothetical protein
LAAYIPGGSVLAGYIRDVATEVYSFSPGQTHVAVASVRNAASGAGSTGLTIRRGPDWGALSARVIRSTFLTELTGVDAMNKKKRTEFRTICIDVPLTSACQYGVVHAVGIWFTGPTFA